jgi:Domain of unknown function DUF11
MAAMRPRLWVLVAAFTLAGSSSALADAPRILRNGSFELPPDAPQGFFAYYQTVNGGPPPPGHVTIVGWNTTSGPAGGVSRPMEIWDRYTMAAADGFQFTEVNVNAPTRIYQKLCMVNGETVGWGFAHRGRLNSDRVVLGLFQSGSQVLSSAQPSVLVQSLATADSGTGAWRPYAGASQVTAPTGVYQLGWEAQDAGGQGNLFDAARIDLPLLAEFDPELASAARSNGSYQMRLRLAGVLRAESSVQVSLSGRGLRPADVNVGDASGAPGVTVTRDGLELGVQLPAGEYEPGAGTDLVTVPLNLARAAERGVTDVRLLLAGAGAGATVGPAADCAGAGRDRWRVALGPRIADVSVSNLGPSEQPRRGATSLWTIRARNRGPAIAEKVRVRTAFFGGSVTAAKELAERGSCRLVSSTSAGCALGDVEPGEYVTVLVEVSNAANADTVRLAARARARTPDPERVNNSASRFVTFPSDPEPEVPPQPGTPAAPTAAANLRVRAPAVTSVAGRRVRYPVAVRNGGPESAPGTALMFTLPSGLRARTPRGCRLRQRELRCLLGTLRRGETATVTVRLRGRAGLHRPVAGVTSRVTDPRLGDNLRRGQVRLIRRTPEPCPVAAARRPVARAAC